MKFKGKKLLVLGGKPIGSYEIVKYAKEQGVYTIVTDFLPVNQSPAKLIADETWNISTADVEFLKNRIISEKIDGVYAGVHEFNLKKVIQICNDLNLPCFCTLKQWNFFNNKRNFKKACQEFDIPVSKEYSISSAEEASTILKNEFPVIVKPIDGSGSRGFSICSNYDELTAGILRAQKYSNTNDILVEKYMDYKNSAIINYTLINGNVFFCGISDKKSKKVFEAGAPIMASQFYPSAFESEYLNNLDLKVKDMFRSYGLKNGVIWIEAFCDNGQFTFNEMGYRFGGSLTYLPVQHYYGVNQLDLQLQYALSASYCKEVKFNRINNNSYAIVPIHVKPGIISKIIGFDELLNKSEVSNIVYVHREGDEIQNWGSAQQVFAYVHISTSSLSNTKNFVKSLLDDIKVIDENGNNILFYLYEE